MVLLLHSHLMQIGVMFLSRFFGRTLFAAKSETPAAAAAAAAAASSLRTEYNPLAEFFEADRSAEDDKPVVYGRSWKASELRLKSWDDLQKLWYVLLKEKNMLMTQRQMLHAQNLRFPNPERIPKVRFLSGCTSFKSCSLITQHWNRWTKKRLQDFVMIVVRKSMCRIKHVLTERAIEEPDPRRSAEMKRMVNAL
ncbi:Ribosomal protein [Trema orientale]|uniref:Large ribosomal subunit protein uL29m n=1 Tax=Trema orientale TaxID=63057 RepID=A0A2P5F6C0_TREOI|nr:Ribosomal protein [Trema orientale]